MELLAVVTGRASPGRFYYSLPDGAVKLRPRPFRMVTTVADAKRGSSHNWNLLAFVFQADDEGSIPFTRSIFKIKDLSEIMRS
jgi:hypothetical protein